GEHAALERVFTEVAPSVERLLRRMLGPRAEIDDLLQITFIGVIKAFPRFRGEASVRTWVCRIAVRSAVDYLRKPEQKRPHLQLVGEGTEHVLDDHRIDERRCLERIYRYLEGIAPKKRVAFILHVFDGHPL